MLEAAIEARLGAFSLAADFAAPAGITAIIGPSGAGKTSLLRLIAGLARPSAGHIRLNGETLFDKGINVPAHQRRIGMVFQEPRLLPHRNVVSNISLAARGNGHSRIGGIADRLGIGALLRRRTGSLSGGEKQRIMLARALVAEPNLILCDEPLSALDAPLRMKLLEDMRAAFAEAGVPVLYVTHSIDEAVKIGGTLMVMRAGRIIDRGDAAFVLSRLGEDLFYESGVSSLLSGRVAAIDAQYSLARISIGSQFAEIAADNLRPGADVRLRLWAKDIILSREKPSGLSARNALAGTIASIETVGAALAEIGATVEGQSVRTRIMRKTVAELSLAPGQKVWIVFKSAGLE